jgi:aspartate racemase
MGDSSVSGAAITGAHMVGAEPAGARTTGAQTSGAPTSGVPISGTPIVGVLGGMGPAATVDFLGKLVEATPARTDQEHLRVLLWSDPSVPDRSAALQGRGPDPTAWLLDGARLLAGGGAQVIAVPCNTAHAFLAPVERQVGVQIVHMIDRTARHVAGRRPPIRRVGLLATTGTVRAGLYQTWLGARDIEVVTPAAEEQDRVARAIAWVKAGVRDGPGRLRASAARHGLTLVGDRLVARGAEALIAGCTEIPLVFGRDDAAVPVIDPTEVLAAEVVAAVAARS